MPLPGLYDALGTMLHIPHFIQTTIFTLWANSVIMPILQVRKLTLSNLPQVIEHSRVLSNIAMIDSRELSYARYHITMVKLWLHKVIYIFLMTSWIPNLLVKVIKREDYFSIFWISHRSLKIWISQIYEVKCILCNLLGRVI